MQRRHNRNPHGHGLHQRDRNTFHIPVRTGHGGQQENIRLVEHRLHLMAWLEARHLHVAFQLVLFDQRAQSALPGADT